MQIDLRHLRTLAALRDTGSLAEAAEQVFLTQSALSHQMKDLEDRLGGPLFVRKTRPVRFTAVGQRLLRLADEVLPLIGAAQRDLDRLVGGDTGRLYMAIECHSCFEWLLPAIERYRDRFPDVELDLAGGFHFAPLPALARGDLDMVITSEPGSQPDLVHVPLFRYEALLVVARGHRLARAEFAAPEDLAGETMISYPVDRSRLDVFARFLDPAGVEPRRLRTAELTPMMIQLVASGRGVACLPNWAVHEYLGRASIATTRLGASGVHPTLYAAMRADQADSRFLASFVEIARQNCFEHLVGILPAA